MTEEKAAPSWSSWRKTVLLALAYFVLARASRLLAIPPGYATAVWPPAGLAVGALWLWGLELWPGVLLGSFAANAWNPGGPPAPAPFELAAWISVGAAAQAVAAVALSRRLIGPRDPLGEDEDLFRFLAAAGPVACLIASTWAIAGMRLLGAISSGESAYSWVTWWAGDAIGVAAAAPMVLIWFGRGGDGSRRARAAVTWALSAVMIGIACVHLYAVHQEERKLSNATARRLSDVSTTLRVGLSGHLNALESTAAFFANAGGVGRAQFARYSAGVLSRHPGMKALEWRPRVRDADRASVEAAARRETGTDYRFRELDGSVRPRAPEYFPILYAEPLKGNEVALGLDLTPASRIREASERALATGRPAASRGVELLQDPGHVNSVVVMVPVLSRDGRPIGLVEGVYNVGTMIDTLLAGLEAGSIGIRVVDETPPGPGQVLYARAASGSAERPLAIHGEFAQRHWRVELLPNMAFGARERQPLSWFVQAAAFAFAYLISWILLTLYGRGERVTALVEERTRELREQERRLMRSQKMESVGRLAGGIAHEFNNILMGASGLAQIVLQTLGPKHPSAPDMEGIIGSVRRASHLVSQLLTYSRRKPSNRVPMDLDAQIAGLSKMIAVGVGGRVSLEVDAAPSPAWIMADPGQVEQVLLNLCFNARDALQGKGKIRVATRPIVLERALETPHLGVKAGRYVALDVADDGPGIPEEALPRLFEPFFTTKPFGEGTGLGLSVVFGIVREHEGGLDIRTAPGEGTVMTVYWPACDPPPPERTPAAEAKPPRGEGLILIVDDEPLMRPLLERLLTGYGYSCVTAAGGNEALEILARMPEIRGVVLDLVMPGMDGLETYDKMAALRPGLKVLMLSGYAPREAELEVARRGLPFLPKPAEPARLALALHKALTGGPSA